MKGFNLHNLEKNDLINYYDHDNVVDKTSFIDYFNFMREFTKNWISVCNDNPSICKLLDVGCGKSSNFRMLKDLGYTYVVGLDSDPICILKLHPVMRKQMTTKRR